MQSIIEGAQLAQQQAQRSESGGDFFVPILPPHCIEIEVAALDNIMWRILCINHPPPLAIPIQFQWAGLAMFDLVKCQQNAIGGIFLSKVDVMNFNQSMSYFATPRLGKYNYMAPLEVRIKVQLPTDHNQLEQHRSGLFNWHQLYFRCQCSLSQKNNNGCRGEVLWFDHAIQFIVNHLPKFFPLATSVRNMFVEFLMFFSTSSEVVMDHITFMYTRELMVEATLEQFDKLEARLLMSYGIDKGTLQVERLIKPTAITIEQNRKNSPLGKCSLNLNDVPTSCMNQRGLKSNLPLHAKGRSRLLSSTRATYGPQTPTNQP